MNPLQVLCRAWERVHAGTHPTARAAIGWEPYEDREKGGPLTRTWEVFLDSFGFTPDVGGRESAALRYGHLNGFGTAPHKHKELAVLGKAIAFAKTRAKAA